MCAFALLILAAYFAGRSGARKAPREPAVSAASRRVLYYLDPMHPAYTADQPGTAPDCGMKLVPVYADSLDTTDSSQAEATAHRGETVPPAGTVKIDPEQQRLIGLRTATVERAAASEKLRVLGKVAVDDARVYRINSGVEGWLREVKDASTGSHVSKDQTLATFYSPEFIALEQGYLVATERMAGTARQQAAPGTQSTAARLRNLGMGEKQIAEIAATRQMPENVDITSPADAFILTRNVSSGQRFEKGMELYRLADLSRVWILAEVVEGEAQYFRPGMLATIHLPGESRTLQARVSDVLPQFDPGSRTLKVRMEADNPGYRLRPEMFVDLEVRLKVPAGLSVPVDALLDAGMKQRVYVDAGDGRFEPRSVTTGWRFGDRVEIVQGLEAGEKVVVSGNFMVDSESRLKHASPAIPNAIPNATTTPALKDAVLHTGMAAGGRQ